MNIPSVTIEQMREVDRIMVEEIGVSILMMMENASRNIAHLARKLLGGSVKNKHIVVLAGKGNNGGDGLGAARHLVNFGAICKVFLAHKASELVKDAHTQFEVLKNSNAEVNEYGAYSNDHLVSHLSYADLVIDALLGYNLKGAPREPIAVLIKLANDSNKQMLAVDIPSGMSGDTGEAYDPAIKATATLTLALPKIGLTKNSARPHIGKLYVADLSVPKVVYDKLGISIPIIFESEEILKAY